MTVIRTQTRACLFLAILMALSGCTPPLVKGNIYRKGYKEGKLEEQLKRFQDGKFAIMPFKGIYENRMMGIATDGNAIADLLSIQMLYHGYDVYERDKMNKILEEKAFKMSDLVAPETEEPVAEPEAPRQWNNPWESGNQQASLDSMQPAATPPPPSARKSKPALPAIAKGEDTQNIVTIGKILGVDFIITGAIIQYQYEISKGGLFGGGGEVVLAVTITTRIIDIQSGDIIFAMSAGTTGDNLPEALDGITLAINDALKEGKVYVWE